MFQWILTKRSHIYRYIFLNFKFISFGMEASFFFLFCVARIQSRILNTIYSYESAYIHTYIRTLYVYIHMYVSLGFSIYTFICSFVACDTSTFILLCRSFAFHFFLSFILCFCNFCNTLGQLYVKCAFPVAVIQLRTLFPSFPGKRASYIYMSACSFVCMQASAFWFIFYKTRYRQKFAYIHIPIFI